MAFRWICLTTILLTVAGLAWTSATAENFGQRKRRPKPHEYGTIQLDTASTANDIAAVDFPHWIHRSKYTCRLCHIDIGFAMVAGETGITERDNQRGLYCGTCHDGTIAFGPKEAGTKGEEEQENCVRCHSVGTAVEPQVDFYEFRDTLPRERFGNGIDWVKAEDEGLIIPVDILDRISIKRSKLQNPREEKLIAKELNMPNIVFSHTKHTVWHGCEVCHPQIFGVNKSANKYTMQEIFDGLYCGGCHGKVSFAIDDCQRCHTEPVI
jgi:c(7)-type cytochrome triheme protein